MSWLIFSDFSTYFDILYFYFVCVSIRVRQVELGGIPHTDPVMNASAWALIFQEHVLVPYLLAVMLFDFVGLPYIAMCFPLPIASKHVFHSFNVFSEDSLRNSEMAMGQKRAPKKPYWLEEK